MPAAPSRLFRSLKAMPRTTSTSPLLIRRSRSDGFGTTLMIACAFFGEPASQWFGFGSSTTWTPRVDSLITYGPVATMLDIAHSVAHGSAAVACASYAVLFRMAVTVIDIRSQTKGFGLS